MVWCFNVFGCFVSLWVLYLMVFECLICANYLLWLLLAVFGWVGAMWFLFMVWFRCLLAVWVGLGVLCFCFGGCFIACLLICRLYVLCVVGSDFGF